ncbi:DUF2235 domain-containing protein [Bradyrhizobium sp. 21]|uniref:DUF2235 domain-containing protein n=1 Tax=Bradyrhizobium sp. 21 TaxID=2782666 RepID=UPI001FF74A8D|nr:DUF2235 domain-containing protein [Bradyrhizobium sp. 21]MCK1384395.1 DUF2235 domain-containing protein [Bradyrhizobium sp. 21]
MRKRIILLLDGTWNDADFSLYDTNIIRLREIISGSLMGTAPLTSTASKGPQLKPGERIASGRSLDGTFENIVFYERGIGTDAGDRFRGGTFGDGLERNVRRAYKFLSFHYRFGDEIFIFGFSRGAYTARSLVGYVAAAGLLRQEWCTSNIENVAWNFYRTAPNDRVPGTWTYLSPYVHDRASMSIDCVGLFDTVGALGIPLALLRRFNRQRYEFHNVDLASITKVNLHALAVDEPRLPFQASVWRRSKFKDLASITEQVWFAGAHADIGGGYVRGDERTAPFGNLDDITLDWMLKRLHKHFPNFPIDLPKMWKSVGERDTLADQHNPRRLYYRAFPTAVRSICNYPTTANRWRYEREVSQDRHAEVVGEMIHVSVLQRLGHPVWRDRERSIYRPRNVLAVLDVIRESYSDPEFGKTNRGIRVVGWNGEPLDLVSGRETVMNSMIAAQSRLDDPVNVRQPWLDARSAI